MIILKVVKLIITYLSKFKHLFFILNFIFITTSTYLLCFYFKFNTPSFFILLFIYLTNISTLIVNKLGIKFFKELSILKEINNLLLGILVLISTVSPKIIIKIIKILILTLGALPAFLHHVFINFINFILFFPDYLFAGLMARK